MNPTELCCAALRAKAIGWHHAHEFKGIPLENLEGRILLRHWVGNSFLVDVRVWCSLPWPRERFLRFSDATLGGVLRQAWHYYEDTP